MADLIYIEKVPADIRKAFSDKVKAIAGRLQVDPNWIMQVMKAESGVNPKARNYQEGHTIAVGLIQFTNAANTGYSLDQIYNMPALQQLDLVEKYFKPYAGQMKSYEDMYLVTFFPAAIGKPDNWVLKTSNLAASTIARQNPAINKNKDGQITVGEFKQYVDGTISAKFRNLIAIVEKKPVASAVALIALLAIGYGAFLYFNRKKIA